MQGKHTCFKASPVKPILVSAAIAATVCLSPVLAEYVKSGISLCIGTVIPSVFPFMIISSFITVSGYAEGMGRLFYLPMKLLFGADRGEACAVSIGLLCGYPTGAITAASMLDRCEISKARVEWLLTFINIPSAPFVINGVGASMLGSSEIGVSIYISVLLSAVITGVILKPFHKRHTTYKKTSCQPPPPLSETVTESIARASKNMLSVCACIITFSVLSGVLCSTLPLNDIAKSALSGFLEISSGAKQAANLSNATYAHLLCASICAFSGLSVHFQIMSACRGRGISFVPFFIAKVAQAILAPAILSVFLIICR